MIMMMMMILFKKNTEGRGKRHKACRQVKSQPASQIARQTDKVTVNPSSPRHSLSLDSLAMPVAVPFCSCTRIHKSSIKVLQPRQVTKLEGTATHNEHQHAAVTGVIQYTGKA